MLRNKLSSSLSQMSVKQGKKRDKCKELKVKEMLQAP
jgi:hypothetical protein